MARRVSCARPGGRAAVKCHERFMCGVCVLIDLVGYGLAHGDAVCDDVLCKLAEVDVRGWWSACVGDEAFGAGQDYVLLCGKFKYW